MRSAGREGEQGWAVLLGSALLQHQWELGRCLERHWDSFNAWEMAVRDKDGERGQCSICSSGVELKSHQDGTELDCWGSTSSGGTSSPHPAATCRSCVED